MPGGIWKNKENTDVRIILTHYHPDLEGIVASDASSYGVGACILHKMTDGTLKPIAHVSRVLLPAEKYIHKSKKKFLGLYSESQSSTTIFMVDTLHYKLQATTHHFWLKKGSSYVYSQQIAKMW